MNKDRFMKDFNGEKIFSLEYDKETLRDMLLLKQEEIEDLKKQLELLVKDDESSQQTIITQRQETERLNNIIKEVREYITSQKLHKIQDTADGLTYQEIKLLEILDKGKE